VTFRVVISPEAEDDIVDIFGYVAENDSIANAQRLVMKLQQACSGLADFPARGNKPKELLDLGIEDFREAHLGPYRIVYSVGGRNVVVHCVIDGRRHMQMLLRRRLLS